MGMMGNAMGPGVPGGPMGFGPNGPNGPNSNAAVAQWVQQQNQNLQEQGLGMNDDPRMMYGPQNPNFSQMMMEGGMFDPDMNMPGGLNNMNLMQSKVPNENLTPEQLQRREEQLATLRKLQQVLLPEQRHGQEFPPGGGGPGQGPGPGGPGMMPGDMNMGMYQQMASKRAMMMAQQNMHGMMERQEMMSEQQFMMSQGMSQFGPGPHPQNMQNMSPAQREWMRLQQEHMMEKRQQRMMVQNGPGPQMGPGMEPGRGGQGPPPPSYYSSIAQKQRHGSVGMASPTSPNMNGPLGSPSMTAQGPDPTDPLMFPTGPQRKSSFSGMDPLGPLGPGGPGPMGPGGPGMGMDPMMQQGSPMNPNMMGPMGMPHNRQTNAQVTLQRAGNPEQFHPDMPSAGPINSSAKPPPSYAQSTKRKREDMEELCKNLQPTPSPQHISYLNQFEGQELTITKQVNTAYREPNSSESQSNQFSQNQVVNSPMHGPNSNKGPMSNSSQTSSGPLGSPAPVTANPGPSPMSGANMRLSHFDPQQQQPHNPSISNSPTGSSGKSSLSNNITSATLANLAKGVENLSNQMQQHMMQGGPFHSIQMQGQQQQQQNQPNSQGPPSHSGPISSAVQSQNQTTNALTTNVTTQTPSTPSVNNTFVNATMSIQQVNIQQNVPPGQNSFNTSGASMQVQQMNMEQTQLSMSQSGGSSQAGSMTQTGSMTQSASMNQSSSMTQSVSMSQTVSSNKNSPAVPQTSKMPNTNMGSPASANQHGGMGSMVGNKMSPFPQSQNPSSSMGMSPQVPGSGRPGSPSFSSSSMGNVQVQQKAPNTIQYLPANQSGMPPEPKNVKPDLGFIQQQFDNSLLNVDGKVPTSKMQYFPSGPGGMGQDPRMGPGQDPRMGPGQDPRMGPGQDPRMGMGQDPRMGPGQDPRMVAGQDPRMGPGQDPRMLQGQDPRMGPGQDPRMGPGQDPRMMPGMDPRMGPGQDPRMGPGQDPRMMSGQDPRMGPSMGQGPDPRMLGQGMGSGMDPRDPRMGPSMGDPRMGDPRMGQRSDPRMGPGMPDLGPGSMGSMTDPRMGPSMGSGMGPAGPVMPGDPMGRPVSSGSPFTGPIGPAVQQSMMMRRGSLTDIPSITGMGGIGSPDPMASMAGMSSSMRENPMSALSSMSGNPMNSVASSPMAAMSNMSNSIMAEQMGAGPMGPGGSMDSIGNMPYNSPPYQGGGSGNNPMMSRPGGPMSLHGMGPRMQGPGGSMGGMSRQGMRMPGPGMGPGPLSPGAPGYSSAQYQQFQQQLYSQGRSRQMSPMDGMMGNPGPGYMGPGMNPGMMPGMHGPM